MYEILGQATGAGESVPEPIQIRIPEIDPMGPLRSAYAGMRQLCEDRYGVDFCSSFLPQTPILREEPLTKKWYFWLITGVVIGKIVL